MSIKRDVASVWCSWTHRPKSAIKVCLVHGCRLHDLAGRPLWPSRRLYWRFRRQLLATRGKDALSNLQAFTKWVPRPTRITKKLVEQNIDIPSKDGRWKHLIQFHWWDTVIKTTWTHSGICRNSSPRENQAPWLNFDTEHLKIILETGIKIVSNQVQFSLIDRRPLCK